MLLGRPLKAHIVANRPGHAINAELTRLLFEQLEQRRTKRAGRNGAAGKKSVAIQPEEVSLDINRVLDVIPHRYPFVMVDRVLAFKDEEILALKNVSFNEPYFNGHFPDHPVMPGVLQLEAMAQAAGILMLKLAGLANKKAYFMSADKVKFRRPVRPGDQLLISARLTKSRGTRLAAAQAECRVGDQIVSSADLLFTLLDDLEPAE
jgi:UDP-3-O-[3-hydroxymyristoyl] N-acetylglucosamine deacetylase/3-hydroxyacyl-[acyl-carrier-protein] dehydratase